MNALWSVLLTTSAATALLIAAEGPKLQVLPLNSTLSNVTIPRYDENKNRVAYLKADLMEILADGPIAQGTQPIMVDCSGIELEMKSAGDGNDVHVNMKRARYRMGPGVLTVQEQITAHSDQFTLQGNGGVFHLDSHRGFLFGPMQCDIFQQPKAQAQMTNPTRFPIAMLASLSLGSYATAATEPQYTPPTRDQLLEVDQMAVPATKGIEAGKIKLNSNLREQKEQTEEADRLLAQFSEQVGSDSLNLLIQNPPKAVKTSNEPPEIKDPTLSITCDGGGFFEGNAQMLVFLRDVVVTEKRFTLKANKELKVFFDEPIEKKKSDEIEKDGDLPQVGIGEVKTLIASGGVNFSGIDKDGNPFEASAEMASYNSKKSQLILKDGRPTFRVTTPKGLFKMKAENSQASVIIDLSESSFSAHTSPNGWQFDLGK